MVNSNMGDFERDRVTRIGDRLRTMVVGLVAMAVLGGCASDEVGETATPVATATVAPTAVAAATATATAVPAGAVPTASTTPVPTVEPEAEPEPTEPTAAAGPSTPAEERSSLPIAQQKAELQAIVKIVFAGETNRNKPRLQIEPDARDHRSGGIWVTADFRGDEFDDVRRNKDGLDVLMRDAFEALFTAGYDLTQVDLTGNLSAGAVGSVKPGVHAGLNQAVFRTRLKREVADQIDWSKKESLDFNEIWETVLLNPRMAKELRELEEGG